MNSEKRFLLIAITDKQGRIGLQAFYDSGAADGDAVVGIGKYSGLPEWRSVHNNVKGLAKKRISVLTNEMHHFVVTYDTQSSELNLRVDGKVIASLQSVEVDLSELTSLYVWGNNTAYIDYISVMSGVPVVE